MIELNVKFQEQYKRLDALCKDLFSSKDGITEYINEMEKLSYSKYRYRISKWDTIFQKLKHLRYIRNQLAHEIGAFDLELCTEDDIEWLNSFYDLILKTNDPLSRIRQAELADIEEKQRQQAQRKNTVTETAQEEKSHPSLWHRIKAKIKEWFS